MQREVGLPILSDGEFRRDFWLSALSDEMFAGLVNDGGDLVKHPSLRGHSLADQDVLVPPKPLIAGTLSRKGRITGREIAFLNRHAASAFKMTIPSPVTLAPTAFKAGVSDKFYRDWRDAFVAYADLIVDEISDMIEDGVSYIQLDAPHYTRYLLPERRMALKEFGVELEEEFSMSTNADNKCLARMKAAGVKSAIHICLGTFILGPQGPLGGAGAYDAHMLGRLIEALDADVFLIEFSERTGDEDALRYIPRGKNVCLGILNTRDPKIETIDFVKRRVDAATKYLPLETLSISPNCGFSGGAAKTWIEEDIQKRKLALLVEAAERIWGRVVEN